MIQPNELRIGNYVKHVPLNTGIFVKIDSEEISYCESYPEEFNDNFKPIELTEEILLKCGFEKLEHLYKLHLLNSLNLIYNSEHNGWYLDIYHNTSKIELRYLHELQNLYFALTGKELEINL